MVMLGGCIYIHTRKESGSTCKTSSNTLCDMGDVRAKRPFALGGMWWGEYYRGLCKGGLSLRCTRGSVRHICICPHITQSTSPLLYEMLVPCYASSSSCYLSSCCCCPMDDDACWMRVLKHMQKERDITSRVSRCTVGRGGASTRMAKR
jgi:hypothetical protein